MDGLYLPNGRQLALIDREWILDELPHLGNPDDNSDANYLLATAAAAANSGSTTTTATLPGRSGPSNGAAIQSGAGGHNQNLLYNPNEFEGDLTLLSEIVDETQNKWSDFGLNQLLTPYARVIARPNLK